jgi:hypothetical protein
MATSVDIHVIEEKLKPLLGKKAWGVALGVGSFITLEFGRPLAPYATKQGREVIHGEWHLWVYDCAWRLETADGVLVASEDDRNEIEEAIKSLEGAALKLVELFPPALDTLLKFDNGLTLRLFPIYSNDADHWMLFTPEKKVLTIGPGTDWSYEDE